MQPLRKTLTDELFTAATPSATILQLVGAKSQGAVESPARLLQQRVERAALMSFFRPAV
jgi:hypothetical protein